MLITSSDTVVPYSRDTLFSNMYPYEGMTSGRGSRGPLHAQVRHGWCVRCSSGDEDGS